MRDPKRIKRILKEIEKHWSNFPDLRFGQLLINLGVVEDKTGLWFVEDDKMEEHLKCHEW